MLLTDSTPQTDASPAPAPAQHHLREAALKALRGARELEEEVRRLRSALAAMPATAGGDLAWKEDVFHLLSKVVLFRVALVDDAERGQWEQSSGQDR